MGQSQPTLLHYRERISHTLPHRGKGSVIHCSNNIGGSVTLYHKGTAKVMGQSHFTVPKVKHQSHFALADVKDQLHIALAMIKDQSHFTTFYPSPPSTCSLTLQPSSARSTLQPSLTIRHHNGQTTIKLMELFFTYGALWGAEIKSERTNR